MKKLITILAFLFVSSGSTDDKDLANTILESPIPRELNIKQICKIYTDYTINLVRYSSVTGISLSITPPKSYELVWVIFNSSKQSGAPGLI